MDGWMVVVVVVCYYGCDFFPNGSGSGSGLSEKIKPPPTHLRSWQFATPDFWGSSSVIVRQVWWWCVTTDVISLPIVLVLVLVLGVCVSLSLFSLCLSCNPRFLGVVVGHQCGGDGGGGV
jgi:hypothetical protein